MRMNAKTAKKLRKMVPTIQAMETQRDETLDTSFHYLEDTGNRATKKIALFDGKSAEFTTVGTIRVNPYSARGIYRHLKKQIAKANGVKFA